MSPAQRGRDVAGERGHVEGGQQTIVDGHEDEAGLHERLGLDAYHALVARLPAAAVNPENYGQILRAVWCIHVQDLPLVRRRIWDIPCHTLGVSVGDAG